MVFKGLKSSKLIINENKAITMMHIKSLPSIHIIDVKGNVITKRNNYL